MKPLFSVIVPIYNVEKYLKNCIESILNQSFSDFELILVDDGSPDRSPEICDRYAQVDRRIKVIHKRNEGLVKARESGLTLAKGAYVGYVDGDDWVKDSWLCSVAEIIKMGHPDIISFNTILACNSREEKVKLQISSGYYGKMDMKKKIYPIMLYNKEQNFYNFGIYPSLCSKIIKKSLLMECKCEDSRITMGEDAACVYKSLFEAESFYIMEQYFYYYRQNQNSMTNAYDENRFEKYELLLDYMEKHLGKKYSAIREQLKYHRAFRIKHAILNESKANGSVLFRSKLLKKKMQSYGYENAFDELVISHASILTKCFIFLIRHRLYFGLILMCDVYKILKKQE